MLFLRSPHFSWAPAACLSSLFSFFLLLCEMIQRLYLFLSSPPPVQSEAEAGLACQITGCAARHSGVRKGSPRAVIALMSFRSACASVGCVDLFPLLSLCQGLTPQQHSWCPVGRQMAMGQPAAYQLGQIRVSSGAWITFVFSQLTLSVSFPTYLLYYCIYLPFIALSQLFKMHLNSFGAVYTPTLSFPRSFMNGSS